MGKRRCDFSTAEHAYASFTPNKGKITTVRTAAKPSVTMFILSHYLFLCLLISTEVHVATSSHVTPLCSSPPPPSIPQALSNLNWNGMY